MSFANDLLTILSDYSGGYKLIRQRIYGYPSEGKRSTPRKLSGDYLRVILFRLKQKRLVKKKGAIWNITNAGRAYLVKNNFLPAHTRIPTKRNTKSLVIVFDIPEIYRKKRNWLRVELKSAGFTMLQQSVWFGPAPLSEELVVSFNRLKLLSYIKFFAAKEADII